MTEPHWANYWAAFVYSYRNLHLLTQDQLAEKLGVSQQTVSRWEAGQQVPDPRSQAVLRKVLGEADLASKKNWIERVRRASGQEVLIGPDLILMSVSGTLASDLDVPPEKMIGKPYARFLPMNRPRFVEKAVEQGFFDGAFARLSYRTEVNLGHATYHTLTDVWPVVTTDAGVLMHVVLMRVPGPQNPGLEGLKVSDLVQEPNNFVGHAEG